MAWTTPTNPVAGTVITVAYAVTNFINNLNWLRGLTGSADPPGSNYTIRSTSTTATDWSKITEDMVTPSALTGNAAGSAIGSNSININRINASVTAAEFARITGSGAVVATANIIDDAVTEPKMATDSVGTTQLIASNVTLAKMASNSVGTTQLVDDAVTAPKIATGAVGNTELASSAVDNSKVSASAAITHDKLAATPSGYNAGSPFVIATSNTTAASTTVGIAGVYEIKVTFVVKMVSTSAANNANVAFTADLYKSSGIFGPQLRKYLPPAASAPGEGYDSQEYWMHFTIQQAMNASEPLALVVVKSGGTGGTRCEQAIISAIRIGP